MSYLIENEAGIRMGVFAGVLFAMIALEFILPKKVRVQSRARRWTANLGLIVVDTIALRVAFPVLAVGMAYLAADKGWGLFNLLAWPAWLEIVLAILLLDMMIYWQHVATHRIPLLWRLHQVHHADRDLDVTSGLRFHPVEIMGSMLFKMALVLLIGPAAMAVILFEIILNACAMFNHSNIRLPERLDAALRRVIVTPDMHRVHHSVLMDETNSNYGFSLSLWDRLFRSYRAQPRDGHDGMTLGLEEYQDDAPARLLWTLVLPFRRRSAP